MSLTCQDVCYALHCQRDSALLKGLDHTRLSVKLGTASSPCKSGRQLLALEIFISHAHTDAKLAEALVVFFAAGVGLEQREIRCTSYLPTGLPGGADINDELRRDIKRCRYFTPLLTPNTEASEFVAFEIGAAWVQEKKIVPLMYSPNMQLRVPVVLAALRYIDITDCNSLVALAGQLATEIFVASDRPSAPQMLAAACQFLANVSG
jgi:hypothetical protein